MRSVRIRSRRLYPALALCLVVAAVSLAPALVRLAGGATPAAATGEIRPRDIPPGYHFPTPRREIDGWVAVQNVAAMRHHAWDIWAGMTASSGVVFRRQELPIWETWYSNDEVFTTPPKAAALAAGTTKRTAITHPLARPHQDEHVRRMAEAFKASGNSSAAQALEAAVAAGAAQQVVAFNKFDGPSGRFLMSAHKTPPQTGQRYLYTQQKDLNNLNASWSAATPIADRKIDEFPATAIDLKPVLWLIKKTGLTPVPLWQGTGPDAVKPGKGSATNPIPNDWLNCVLIDPQGHGKLRPATPAEVGRANADSALACDPKKYLYAPLSAMYSFEMSAAEVQAFNAANQGAPGLTAGPGDFAALVAMHVTSKEIVNWTWQTFWWDGGKNPPSDFPGSSTGITAQVKGPWRNYSMCVAYSMVVPANDPKGKPVVCFNPFLETSQVDGLQSNCMSCHGTARWPASNNPFYPQTYVPNGYIDFSSVQWFGGQTHNDFVWAINVNAQ